MYVHTYCLLIHIPKIHAASPRLPSFPLWPSQANCDTCDSTSDEARRERLMASLPEVLLCFMKKGRIDTHSNVRSTCIIIGESGLEVLSLTEYKPGTQVAAHNAHDLGLCIPLSTVNLCHSFFFLPQDIHLVSRHRHAQPRLVIVQHRPARLPIHLKKQRT